MVGLWQMVRREWAEWRLLLFGALLLGWLPWAAPLLPSMSSLEPSSAREAVCLLVTLLFALGSGGILGAALHRDIGDGRLSFYLSRPLKSGSYWGGKSLGVLSVWAAAMVLVVLPTLLAGWASGESFFDPVDSSSSIFSLPLTGLEESMLLGGWAGLPDAPAWPWIVLGVLLAVSAVLSMIHWVASAAQVRGAWLGFDVVALAVLGVLLWAVRDDLLAAQAFGALVWLERLWLAALGPILWCAGYRQIALGRTDEAKGYLLFSRTAWVGLASTALLTLGLTGWFLSGTAEDLKNLQSLKVSPDGCQVFVTGELRGRAGRHQSFLLEVEPGPSSTPSRVAYRETPVGGLFPSTAGWRFSADGRRALWAECRRLVRTRCELWTRDLGSDEEPRATGIEVRSLQAQLALSPDGDKVALGTRDRIEVYGLPAGNLITAVKTEPVLRLEFVDTTTLRSTHYAEGLEIRHLIRRLDLDTGVSQVTGELFGGMHRESYMLDPAADQMLFLAVAPRRAEVRDGWTGEVLVDLSERLGLRDHVVSSAAFLPDGRLTLVASTAEFEIDGSERGSVDLEREVQVLVLDPSLWEGPGDGPVDPADAEAAGQAPGPLVQRLALSKALTVRLGEQVEPGAVTLLVRRHDEQSLPDWLAPDDSRNGPQPIPQWSTWVLRPGAEEAELWAGGVIPPPLPPLFAMGSTQLGTAGMFLARDRSLFVLRDGRPLMLLDGFEPRGLPELMYLSF